MNRLPAGLRAIVIGGSAGGIQALMQLLPALPPAAPVAVVVVLHLMRGQRSVLADILRPLCRMAVLEAEDKMPLEPGRIYVAPPDYHLLVDGAAIAEGEPPTVGAADGEALPRRWLALSADEPVKFSRPSIDLLFESAADLFGRALLGVLLSGGNDDGVDGLEAIRAAGGLAIVQQPATAQVPFMPEAAIRRGCVDGVLPIAELSQLFQALDPGGEANGG
jgi:two-component system chemotaxis response regulator CheB